MVSELAHSCSSLSHYRFCKYKWGLIILLIFAVTGSPVQIFKTLLTHIRHLCWNRSQLSEPTHLKWKHG